jgi:predicted Fe-Mo cluster-binding NifX family protein
MKIAIATRRYTTVASHAGQTREWLIFDCVPGTPIPEPAHIELTKAQVLHHFADDGPHPLDGVEIVIAASAGDGFVRHMAKRGAQVLLTGETDPSAAFEKVLAGEALPDTRFDITTTLCKLRDLFSRH